MNPLSTKQLLACLTLIAAAPSHADVIATFDDLPTPPPLNSATGLQWANGANGLNYLGVSWDNRFTVVGDAYQVAPGPGNPTFGLPRSGHYFVSNQSDRSGNNGLSITTSKVLTGAWFGRNEYYGFGGGADQVTIVALNGATELSSVVFDLPLTNPGSPEPLSFVDTSIFASVAGITGYRIDRRELGQQSGNWVADDFTFVDATQVPAPGGLPLMLLGLAAMAGAARRRLNR